MSESREWRCTFTGPQTSFPWGEPKAVILVRAETEEAARATAPLAFERVYGRRPAFLRFQLTSVELYTHR